MTGDARPTLTVIAGPNGSGKSTWTRTLRADLQVPVIDPDAIARELNSAAPEQAAVAVGREALRRQAVYIESGTSFIVETTLSGNTPLRQIEQRDSTVSTRAYIHRHGECPDKHRSYRGARRPWRTLRAR